jgi:hypothetical protein
VDDLDRMLAGRDVECRASLANGQAGCGFAIDHKPQAAGVKLTGGHAHNCGALHREGQLGWTQLIVSHHNARAGLKLALAIARQFCDSRTDGDAVLMTAPCWALVPFELPEQNALDPGCRERAVFLAGHQCGKEIVPNEDHPAVIRRPRAGGGRKGQVVRGDVSRVPK